MNQCEIEYIEDMPVATFEFVEGVMLSELLDACLEKNDEEGFKALFNEYYERISYNETAKVADYDLIFSNILVNGDEWTVIDYEWTFDREYPARELAFRALYCYLLESESRNKCNMDEMLKILKITEKDSEELRNGELSFQKWVTKKRISMSEMRDKIGYKIVSPQKYIEENKEKECIERVQIYENKGQGYSEAESYFLKTAEFTGNHMEMDVVFDGNVTDLRIDPLMDACVVLIKELTVNGYPLPDYSKKYIEVNGRSLKGEVPGFVFPTSDPNMNLHVSNMPLKGENTLHCVMEFARMPEEIGANLMQSVKRIF